MKLYEIAKGTSFYIDSKSDTKLGAIPVQLSEDLHVSAKAVVFTKCDCGSCNRELAVILASKSSHLIFDQTDLVEISSSKSLTNK
jgi:hypothetical protein